MSKSLEGACVNSADINDRTHKDKGCPYMNDEFDECYTSKLTSLNMAQAIHYCLGDYKSCEIYTKLKEEDRAN